MRSVSALGPICSTSSRPRKKLRADVIRQFHERGKDVMTEVLIALEENDAARQAIIEELRSMV